MKATELRSASVEELNDKLVSYKKELFNLRFQQVSGELKNTSRFREVKKAVARVHTLLTEKKS